jgi:hypothetical protein
LFKVRIWLEGTTPQCAFYICQSLGFTEGLFVPAFPYNEPSKRDFVI